ncbi:RNA-directed DNA polymerase, eukaryota, reverse transcriptase zinc-binding domain protein [Tanacetum coccineum]
MWGKFSFDFACSMSRGRSRGLKLMWDTSFFIKSNMWCDDNFIIIQDFNEVRFESELCGSICSQADAQAFNSFIGNSGLIEIPMGGRLYTWMNKAGSKLRKLDHFLLSEDVATNCLDLKAIVLDKLSTNPGFTTLCNEDVTLLQQKATLDEIHKAVWDCGNDKSPGPNHAQRFTDEELHDMARVTGCHASSFPITYLGLQIGKSMHFVLSRNILIDKFISKLSKWKASLLSIGGRYTLIRSILGSLGIYYLSMFKAPETVINILKKYRARFFWGGSNEKKKMAWVRWENILVSRDQGGLGIGSLKAFNLALLQKWRWRFTTNPNLLWVKLIKVIHGYEAGFDGKGCPTSGIWSTIVGSTNYSHSHNLLPKDLLKCLPGNVSVITKAHGISNDLGPLPLNLCSNPFKWSLLMLTFRLLKTRGNGTLEVIDPLQWLLLELILISQCSHHWLLELHGSSVYLERSTFSFGDSI